MAKTVFTNGCFDILHIGHIKLLEEARSKGDKLIVGINSDRSVRSIKGANRPVNNERDRAAVLLALNPVDEVRVFDDLTPAKLIEEIRPDVLVKGADWNETEIVGAEFVRQSGGEVLTIPVSEGYSTTKILKKLLSSSETLPADDSASERDLIGRSIRQHIEVFEKILSEQSRNIRLCAEMIYDAIAGHKKILLCGNGGSAADAQHIAAEFVGRFEKERNALPAIALTTDTSILTAVSNDYGYRKVFSRQIEAFAREGDVLIAISTSGNSPNVLEAVMRGREKGCRIIGLAGANGGKLAGLCDGCVLIETEKTSRIQEAHITIGHIWCEYVDMRSGFD